MADTVNHHHVTTPARQGRWLGHLRAWLRGETVGLPPGQCRRAEQRDKSRLWGQASPLYSLCSHYLIVSPPNPICLLCLLLGLRVSHSGSRPPVLLRPACNLFFIHPARPPHTCPPDGVKGHAAICTSCGNSQKLIYSP